MFVGVRVMSNLKEVITAYHNLSFSDRVAFYCTLSNDIDVREENLQNFLIETRLGDKRSCISARSPLPFKEVPA